MSQKQKKSQVNNDLVLSYDSYAVFGYLKKWEMWLQFGIAEVFVFGKFVSDDL